MTLTKDEEVLAHKLLKGPYTFIQIHAGLGYTTPEFWTHVWNNANYSLKSTISSVPVSFLDDLEPTEEDYLLLLEGPLSPVLLNKCLALLPGDEYPFSFVNQPHLPEQSIIEQGKKYPRFFTHFIRKGFEFRTVSDELMLILLEHSKDETISQIIKTAETISYRILSELLQPGLKTTFFWNILDKIDIENLPDSMVEPLLTTLTQTEYFSSPEMEETYQNPKWRVLIDKFWASKGIQSHLMPSEFVIRNTFEHFKPGEEF